jgi:hypothetical protein
MSNLSGEKKPEIIIDKNLTYFVLEGKIRGISMKEISDQMKIISEDLKNSSFSFDEFNRRFKKASN